MFSLILSITLKAECKYLNIKNNVHNNIQYNHHQRWLNSYIVKLRDRSNIKFYSFKSNKISCVDKFIDNDIYRLCFVNNITDCEQMNEIDDSIYLEDEFVRLKSDKPIYIQM